MIKKKREIYDYGEFQPFEPMDGQTLNDAPRENRLLKTPTPTVGEDLGKPSPSDVISKTIAENPLSSPYFDRIRQNEARRQILAGMPDKDENGRTRSGLRALVEGLGTYFDPKFGVVKNWTDFNARLAGAGGKALGGVINPAWDEKADREKEIAKIDEETTRLLDLGQKDWQMRMQTANFGLNQQKEVNRQTNEQNRQDLRARELDLREARQNFQKLNTEQKTALSIIFKRGYYKEGINKNEDAQLEKFGIVLPDFDSRKPIVREQAGKFQQFDEEKREWVDAPGMPVDESEVPIEFSIGGVRMKLRPRDIAGIEAAKERQTSQQDFTASENEKNRSQRWQMFVKEYQRKVENDAKNRVLNKAQELEKLNKSLSAGDITQEQYDEMKRIIDAY